MWLASLRFRSTSICSSVLKNSCNYGLASSHSPTLKVFVVLFHWVSKRFSPLSISRFGILNAMFSYGAAAKIRYLQ